MGTQGSEQPEDTQTGTCRETGSDTVPPGTYVGRPVLPWSWQLGAGEEDEPAQIVIPAPITPATLPEQLQVHADGTVVNAVLNVTSSAYVGCALPNMVGKTLTADSPAGGAVQAHADGTLRILPFGATPAPFDGRSSDLWAASSANSV